MEQQAQTTSSSLRFQSRWLDVACVLTVWLVSFSFVWVVTAAGSKLPYDAFRDLAWAENILQGRVWADPSIKGATWWYVPAGPALTAGWSWVTGADSATVCARSALVINPMIAVLLFLVVRRSTDRWVGLATSPFLLFGSMWWLTHIGAAMPSVQAVLGSLLFVWLWARCVDLLMAKEHDRVVVVRRGALAGVVLAGVAWWHPICAVVAAGAVALHGLGLVAAKGASRNAAMLSLASVAGVSAILSAPALWHLLFLPRHNPIPLRFVAKEMANPDFALGAYAPGVSFLALIGVVMVVKTRPVLGWAVGWLGVALAGQLPAYLPNWRNAGLPALVPHEFQWHGQLAIAVLASVGLVEAARYASRRYLSSHRGQVGAVLLGIVVGLGVLAPVAPYLRFAGAYLGDLEGIVRVRAETVNWIRGNTSIDAVFACVPADAYMTVAGLTGRKCAALPAGHTNPAVYAQERLAAVKALLASRDESEFVHRASQLEVGYLLIKANSLTAQRQVREYGGWRSLTEVFASPKERTTVFSVAEAR